MVSDMTRSLNLTKDITLATLLHVFYFISFAHNVIKKTEREKKIKDNKINIHALKTKKNNCLIRQEYHNSSKPITVVPGFKKYVKKKQTTNKQNSKGI